MALEVDSPIFFIICSHLFRNFPQVLRLFLGCDLCWIFVQVTAGGKLYNVIVDTEDTAKSLLKHGKLTKRVTILPLNNINRKKVKFSQSEISWIFQVEAPVLKKANDVVGDQAKLALSLVVFDDQVEAAMNFVFGNTFVCENSGTAKKITFNDQIKVRSVTTQGDVFDPAGTLTGDVISVKVTFLTLYRRVTCSSRKSFGKTFQSEPKSKRTGGAEEDSPSDSGGTDKDGAIGFQL